MTRRENTLQHYSWLASPYSGKTRTYLRFKGIPHEDVPPTARQLLGTIKGAVGQAIMPTVLLPDGTWLQDSSDIIDTLEAKYPTPSIVPQRPIQKIASLLLELHGDEWLPLFALHYRWNVPENKRFALADFAKSGFPTLPGILARRLITPFANKMAGYAPKLGVNEATIPGIVGFAIELIARLEVHFEQTPFLLGGRPCHADFALFGPLWAHGFRDPGSTHLFDHAPHVRAWFDRLLTPAGAPGDFLDADEIPTTLDPIFRTLFEEQFVFLQGLIAAIDEYCAANPDAKRVPRSLGDHPFTFGGAQGERRLVTASQWMAQRPLDVYAGLGEADRSPVDAWLRRVGGFEAMQTQIRHPFERRNFKMVLR